ncbi:hypothetical protein CANINC_004443 [Pichia inconspicua]|uniref:Uncharacterized protein n=1 Tax=Pichia inconspicua TaxID=52247 RepID=A0A4T0WV98_9ASCO|nr:hypothetical protein CANINC_004443 [[Candida] inconspicua]
MPFSQEFYRREFFDIESIGSTDYPELSQELEKIRNSSMFLKSLQIADTESLRSFLHKHEIQLSSLFNDKNSGHDYDREDDTTETTDLNARVDPMKQPTKFIELSELKKYSTSLIVNIEGIPKAITSFYGLTENLLDSIIDFISKQVPTCLTLDGELVQIDAHYKWSCMKDENNNYEHNIFVFFNDIMMEYLFYQLIIASDFTTKSNINVIFSDKFIDEILQRLEKETTCDLDKLSLSSDELETSFVELQQIGNAAILASKPDDDYLTKCQKLAENYNVNPKDLAMVPANMVEEVKKYILDFRLHVLTDLENSRNERAKKDQKKAKREFSSTSTDKHNMDTDVSILDNGKNLSDIEYETLLQKREKVLNDKQYYIRLSNYKRKEEHRLKAFKNFLAYNKHDSYVKNVLPQNRQKFLSNFVDNVTNTNNKIDKNFNYYIKHANYLKFRSKAKELEEKTDIQDENNESKM